MEPNPSNNSGLHGLTSRACDNCRARKIKCDRASPCSNCSSTKAPCRTSPKVRDQRQRVLISHQYEKKIEAIDERLAEIERMLRELVDLPTPQKSSRVELVNRTDRQNKSQTLPTVGSDESSHVGHEFEGEPSFNVHSAHASELFEKTVGNSPLAEQNPEMMDALASLRELVSRQKSPSSINSLRFPGQKSHKSVDLSAMELPPLNIVLTLFKLCKENYPFFLLSTMFMEVESFIELCKDAYFCTGEYSVARFASVNCGLLYLFEEYQSYTDRDPLVAQFGRYIPLCRSNFEACISSFDLFMDPTRENVHALALAACHAAEISKPLLCWNFVSAAARMCQSLGYHRSPPDYTANAVFWFVYVLDKNLTLCLGRTSTIQDYDIAVDLPELSSDPKFRPWQQAGQSWIDYSRIAGQLYEQLYSVKGLAQDVAVRTKNASELAASLGRWRQEALEIDFSQAHHGAERGQFMAQTVDLSYYFLLTLIYRSIPSTQSPESPPGLNPECIQAARSALRIHQQFVNELKDGDIFYWKGYINWSLLQIPFTPFIVLFSHTIATSDLDDLSLLEEVSSSLKYASSISEAAERLYRLCSVFYRVAKIYVESRLQDLSGQNANPNAVLSPHAGGEFDSYLAALGFGPQASISSHRGMGGHIGAQEAAGICADNPEGGGASSTVQDWYFGNPYMMGLLDTDL